MYTNEDLYFYNILLKNGFKKDVDIWIDEIVTNSEQLEGIILEVAWYQNNINKLIKCIDDYFLDNDINDIIVCEKLKQFILEKIYLKEISCYQAAKYLFDFSESTDRYDDNWIDLRLLYYESDSIGYTYSKEEFDEFTINYLTHKTSNNSKINLNNKSLHNFTKIYNLEVQNRKFRELYNIPSDLYTNYEYYHLFKKDPLTNKFNIFFCILAELLCLLLTVGLPLFFNKFSVEVSISLVLFGLMLGIYGFSILCGYKVKGIKFSILPVMCYAIPLAFSYYILNIKTSWINGTITIIFGSILFVLFFLYYVIIPYKKYNEALSSYLIELPNKYPNFKYYRDYNHQILWDKSGSHIIIASLNEGICSVSICDKVIYNKINLKEQIVCYKEINDTYENCVKQAIEDFKQYKENNKEE